MKAPRRVRLAAVLLCVAVSLSVSPPTAHADTQWRPTLRRAVAYAEARQGSVSIAVVGTEGRLHGHDARRAVPTASVLKVMFMVAYLRLPDVRDRSLRPADRALLGPMIRRSDNDTATVIADLVGGRRMDRVAELAGMRQFSYTRPWGLSTTSARDQARFMVDLHRWIPRRHRAYALRLLTRIVPSQRWGIGEVATQGWRQHFKGGWGSGTGWVDHQVVRLRHTDGTRVGLAVMIRDSPSHDYGKRTLRGVFARLLRDLPGRHRHAGELHRPAGFHHPRGFPHQMVTPAGRVQQ